MVSQDLRKMAQRVVIKYPGKSQTAGPGFESQLACPVVQSPGDPALPEIRQHIEVAENPDAPHPNRREARIKLDEAQSALETSRPLAGKENRGIATFQTFRQEDSRPFGIWRLPMMLAIFVKQTDDEREVPGICLENLHSFIFARIARDFGLGIPGKWPRL